MRFIDSTEELHDFERDVPNTRLVHLENGRSLRLERKDPFGFVFIGWDRGPTPEALQSAFTDFDQARNALANYLANNTFESISSEPTEKVAPLKYKKKFRDPETDENLPV
jgi:hypothetical protein